MVPVNGVVVGVKDAVEKPASALERIGGRVAAARWRRRIFLARRCAFYAVDIAAGIAAKVINRSYALVRRVRAICP